MRFVSNTFRKLFKLPTPKELGKSATNSLPMECFGSKPGDYTWEQYHAEMKEQYPAKFFFAQTIPTWWNVKVSMNIEHFFYWLKSNTYRKQHFIDLRQPGPNSDYRWGYIDDDFKMLYACFNVLCDHYNCLQEIGKTSASLENDLNRSPNSDELCLLKKEIKYVKEVEDLYKYWTEDRPKLKKQNEELLHEWSESKFEKLEDDKEKWNKLTKDDAEFEKLEDDMLYRLIKIRRQMWI